MPGMGTRIHASFRGFRPSCRTAAAETMITYSHRSLRRAYLEWVDEQVEAFKDRIPRAQLLDLADEVCTDLRMSRGGQYQLTELLLCSAVNRRVFRMLKLPGFRAWCELQRQEALAPREPASYDLLAGLAAGEEPVPAPSPDSPIAQRMAAIACVS
jgi:hypothetical protein